MKTKANWRDHGAIECAVAELAKCGRRLPDFEWEDASPKLRSAAAELRRCVNALADAPTNENTVRAMEVIAGIIGEIDGKIDARDGFGAQVPAGDANVWHNQATGAPVPVVGRENVGKMRDALGVKETPDFTLGDFVRGVAGMRTTESVRNALSVGTDGSGGYAVPSILWPDFVDALVPVSSVLSAGARVIKLDQAAKSFRLARVATVPTAAWRSEAGAVAESDPSFSALDLTPQSLAFYFKISRELLADSPNVDAMLQRAIVQAIAKAIDAAALRGSGTPPEIRGLSNISGIGSVTNGAAGTALATIKWSNLTSAVQTIMEANGPMPTAAIMAPRTLVGFGALADSTAQPLQRPSLLDPVQFIATSALPVNETVGGSTDCSSMYVGDFREFVIGLREDVSILVTKELHAGNAQVGFYVHSRVDVGCLHPASFVKVTGIRP